MKPFDIVYLRQARPDLELEAGACGTVLDLYENQGMEVEFSDQESSRFLFGGFFSYELLPEAVWHALEAICPEHDILWSVAECLYILSADFETQIGAFPHFVVVADELAQSLNGTSHCWQSLADAGRLRPEIIARLRALDARFKAMSGSAHAEIWTLQALETHPFWTEIRSSAREIFAALTPSPKP